MSDRDTEALRALAGTIRNAAADPSSPWYGSDLVEVMAEAAAVVERLEALLMDRARLQARLAVLMSAMACLARGEEVDPKIVVARSDEAALAVRPEDLVTARTAAATREGRDDE